MMEESRLMEWIFAMYIVTIYDSNLGWYFKIHGYLKGRSKKILPMEKQMQPIKKFSQQQKPHTQIILFKLYQMAMIQCLMKRHRIFPVVKSNYLLLPGQCRSEERRVGKERRLEW